MSAERAPFGTLTTGEMSPLEHQGKKNMFAQGFFSNIFDLNFRADKKVGGMAS